MNTKLAVKKADELLRKILETQPHLTAMQTHRHEKSGQDMAEFISSLRLGLIDMYSKTPGEDATS